MEKNLYIYEFLFHSGNTERMITHLKKQEITNQLLDRNYAIFPVYWEINGELKTISSCSVNMHSLKDFHFVEKVK
jgi:hypothetical protein